MDLIEPKAADMVATLKDIAEQVGVSTTTVSRILNGRETGVPIRAETRQRVLQVASELGYRPNIMARALRGSRSSLIGVIAQNITSLFHSQILRGLNAVALKRSYRVFLGHGQRQVDIAIDYGSMFEHFHADGILIIGALEGNEEAWQQFTRQHRYVVGVSDRTAARGFPGIYTDSVIGTQLALDHLWSLGHRNIVCVSDPHLRDGRLRIDVYERYLRERGAAEMIRVYPTPRSFESSYRTGRAVFADPNRPSAIFAGTDAIAVGLMQAAFQAGIRIPEQVSIVGYDDIDIAAYLVPPLTTIRQSGFEMGEIAANLLLDMIEQQRDPSEVEDIVLAPTLVARQSAAPPAV